MRHFFLAVVCAALLAACRGEPRPLIGQVTSVSVKPFAGDQGIEVTDQARVGLLVSEANALREGGWESFAGKVGACSMVFTFASQSAVVAKLYVGRDSVIELLPGKAHSGFIRELAAKELPVARRLLSEVGQAKVCTQ
jgi:hypothetical protein